MRLTSAFALTALVVSVSSTSFSDVASGLSSITTQLNTLDAVIKDPGALNLLELVTTPTKLLGIMAFRTEALKLRTFVDQTNLSMKSLSSPLSESEAQQVINSFENMKPTVFGGFDFINSMKGHTIMKTPMLCSQANKDLSLLNSSLAQLGNQLATSSPASFAERIATLRKEVDDRFDETLASMCT